MICNEKREGVGIKKLSCYRYKCITTLKLGQYSFFKTYEELSVVAAKCQLAGLALRSNMFPSAKPGSGSAGRDLSNVAHPNIS